LRCRASGYGDRACAGYHRWEHATYGYIDPPADPISDGELEKLAKRTERKQRQWSAEAKRECVGVAQTLKVDDDRSHDESDDDPFRAVAEVEARASGTGRPIPITTLATLKQYRGRWLAEARLRSNYCDRHAPKPKRKKKEKPIPYEDACAIAGAMVDAPVLEQRIDKHGRKDGPRPKSVRRLVQKYGIDPDEFHEKLIKSGKTKLDVELVVEDVNENTPATKVRR
jgi:hypothetical protein